ncbi:MAG: hypothetical protein ACMXYB_03055 [Candidatus Woesearchaeota archaeon]
MLVDINSLLQECDSTISQINSQLEQISTQEQQYLELRGLLGFKREFLDKVRELVTKDKEGIKKATQYIQLDKYGEFLKHFKQDLDTFSQYFEIKNDLNPNIIKQQLSWLKTQYEIFLKDDVELQKLLQLKAVARDYPYKKFENEENKVYQIMQETFGVLDDNFKSSLFSQQGAYLFTLLYEMSESEETYKSVLEKGFTFGVFQAKSIQQLPSFDLLQVIQKFINLRNFCQSDETYKHILFYAIAYGVLQAKSIQQLSSRVLLQVISKSGQQFISLRDKCQSEKSYRDILFFGFKNGVFQAMSINQLQLVQLLQVISEFVSFRDKCQSDDTYKSILSYGFAYGILQVENISRLPSPQLLQVISEFGRQFIHLRDSCQSDETFKEILTYGFAYGILQVENISHLPLPQLFQVISESGQQLINLRALTTNAFQDYIKIILKIVRKESNFEDIIQTFNSLLELCKKLRVESYSRFEFIFQLNKPYSELIQDEDYNKFISEAKILIPNEYEAFKQSQNKLIFFENQGRRLQEIFQGDLQEEISDQLVGLVRYVFYTNDQTRTFAQYQQNLLNWKDRNNDIPVPIRNFSISIILKGVEYSLKNFKSSNLKKINTARAIFERYSSVHEKITQSNINPSTKEQILSQLLDLLQFKFTTKINELQQNEEFIIQRDKLFFLIYSYVNSNQVEFMHSLESEFEEKYEIIFNYITYLNDTLFEIFRDLLNHKDYANIRQTPIFEKIQSDFNEKKK